MTEIFSHSSKCQVFEVLQILTKNFKPFITAGFYGTFLFFIWSELIDKNH